MISFSKFDIILWKLRFMATMTVRNLPDSVHRRLRLHAAKRGISTEAAVRELLAEATRPSRPLCDQISAYAQKHAKKKAVKPLSIERDHTPIEPAIFK